MKTRDVAARVLVTWVYLVAVQAVLGMLITSPTPVPANAGPWFLLSNFSVALVLCLLAMRSDWRGARLAVAVSGLPTIIMLTNYLEGIIFLTGVTIDWPKEVLRTCMVSVLTMPLWPLLFRRRGMEQDNSFRPLAGRTVKERLWRFVLADLAYPVLYFIAGLLVFPFVRDFYATQTIPPVGLVFTLQLLVRGPIFLGVCLLMTRMLGLARLPGAATVGAAFATLSGIAPLLVPSGVFPEAVRWAHFVEVTTSNFIFGLIVAWLWGPKDRVKQMVSQAV